MLIFVSLILFLVLVVLMSSPRENWKPITGILLFFMALMAYYLVPAELNMRMIETSVYSIEIPDGSYQVLEEDRAKLISLFDEVKAYRHQDDIRWTGESYWIRLMPLSTGSWCSILATESNWYYSDFENTYKLKMPEEAFEVVKEIKTRYEQVDRRPQALEGVTVQLKWLAEEDGWSTYSLVIDAKSHGNFVIDHVVLERYKTGGGYGSSTFYGESLSTVFKDEIHMSGDEEIQSYTLKIRGKSKVDGKWIPMQMNHPIEGEEVL